MKRVGVDLRDVVGAGSYVIVIGIVLEIVHVLLFIILKAHVYILNCECGGWM